jgi:hypothetical protein
MQIHPSNNTAAIGASCFGIAIISANSGKDLPYKLFSCVF